MAARGSGAHAAALEARQAARQMAGLPAEARDAALLALRHHLLHSRAAIEAANRRDKAAAREANLSPPLLARLDLEGARFDAMLAKLDEVRALPDPVGAVGLAVALDERLELRRVACPIGVLCVIFESRPEAVVQIAALALRSANALILKGGKEAACTNAALVGVVQGALRAAGALPPLAVQLVEGREEVGELLKLTGLIDLVIARGSNQLVASIMANTRIPVMGHADGICSVYVDESARVDTAVRVVVDSKTDYPVACNAAETLLLHRATLSTVWPVLGKALVDAGVSLRLDSESLAALSPHLPPSARGQLCEAEQADFRTEFGALTLAVRCVDSTREAVEHINEHGSHHTDAIISSSEESIRYFQANVDSAGVYANASTRFADGQRYGFGAEVGVSTNRIHSRGPMGVEGLLIYKYLLHGDGHRACDYGAKKKKFLHLPLPLTARETGAVPLVRKFLPNLLLVACGVALSVGWRIATSKLFRR